MIIFFIVYFSSFWTLLSKYIYSWLYYDMKKMVDVMDGNADDVPISNPDKGKPVHHYYVYQSSCRN